MARAERAYKPYGRSREGRADADAGSWKHDLHQSSSLADRLSPSSAAGSSSRPSLLSRISGGQGKELLPSGSGRNKLFGFGAQPPANGNNVNAGVELLPPGGGGAGPVRTGRATPKGFQAQPGQRSLVQSGFNAALGLGLDERSRRERRSRELMREDGRQAISSGGRNEGVSILGAGKTTTMVRVANLAYGTTAEDVVSAFAPLPIINASISSTPSAELVSVDLELNTTAEANELISKYDGQIADGNKLSVTIIRQSLKDRMGSGQGQAQSQSAGRQEVGSSASRQGSGRGQELLDTSSSGKMYSDTILQSNPNAYIQTLAEERAEAERNRQRADAWSRNGGGGGAQRNGRQAGHGSGSGSLAARLGGAGGRSNYRGRGQAGGGMMVD